MATELPQSMRASQWTTNKGGLEKSLSVSKDAALPKPVRNGKKLSDGYSLVRVAFATVNPVDYKIADTVGTYIMSKPAIPGLDYSGTIVQTTRQDLKPGDRVFGKTEPPAFGTLATYLVVGREGCVKLPDGVSLQDAATIGVVGLTAYQTIAPHLPSSRPDSGPLKVLINGGSGGTGAFGIQIAKALGCHVTTTCSGPNVELCKSLGADDVIDYKVDEPVQTLTRRGTRYDLIVDNVFSPGAGLYFNAASYLKEGAKYVNIAGDTSFASITTLLKAMLLPRWLGGGSHKFVFVSCVTTAEHYQRLAEWMANGQIKAQIEKVYELEEAGQAYERLKSGRVRGKLVIRVEGESK